MRVDATRKDVLSARVDHLVGRYVERLADQRDRLVLDVEIGDVIVGGGNDTTAANQNRHLASSVGGLGEPSGDGPPNCTSLTFLQPRA